MTLAAEQAIRDRCAIYSALRDVLEEHWDRFLALNEGDVFELTIRKMQGKVNPMLLRDEVERLR